MSAQHTPGPWQAEWPDEGGPRYVASAAVTVCQATAVCELREDQEADARLIAAAPELLVALDAALDFVEDDTKRWPAGSLEAENAWAVWHRASAAIAKARGEA